MNLEVPRLRMFAGPNGSGKSTIKEIINKKILGIYVNPDEIEKEINRYDYLDLREFNIKTNLEEIQIFFENSTLVKKLDLLEEFEFIRFGDDKIIFHEVIVNSYHASVIADFIRKKLLEMRASFTFETVMSSPDKIELLKLAQKLGYRTYLYFIATKDPLINISRVRNRVKGGGHPVPEDKIVSRYYRSLDLLFDAVKATNRTYIFDNSNTSHIWICEITDSRDIKIKTNTVPKWFNDSVIKKIK